jgi:hypothetical protein
VAVMSQPRHGGAVTGHVAVASELAPRGAAQGGVVCEEVGVVDSPHEFLLVGVVIHIHYFLQCGM